VDPLDTSTSAAWLPLYRSGNSIELTMMAGALEAQELPVRIVGGMSGAAVGAGEAIASGALMVPADRFDEVRSALLELMELAPGEIPEGLAGALSLDIPEGTLSEPVLDGALSDPLAPETEGLANATEDVLADSPPESDEPVEEPPRRSLMAVGVSLLWPGLGHMYARERWTGWLLAIGFGLLIVGTFSAAVLTGPVTLAAVYVWGLVGGPRAVARANRGTTPGPNLQLVLTAAVAFGIHGLGVLVTPHLFPDFYVERVHERLAPMDDEAAAREAAGTCEMASLSLKLRAPLCAMAASLLVDTDKPGDVEGHRRGFRYASMGCDGKSAFACAIKAHAYRHGLGVRRDPTKAASLRRTACYMGFDPACRR